jgi:hypothetical protein
LLWWYTLLCGCCGGIHCFVPEGCSVALRRCTSCGWVCPTPAALTYVALHWCMSSDKRAHNPFFVLASCATPLQVKGQLQQATWGEALKQVAAATENLGPNEFKAIAGGGLGVFGGGALYWWAARGNSHRMAACT